MSEIITAAEHITPNWLTTILRREGVLEAGQVESVTIGTNPAFNSAISHLHVAYGPGSSPGAPRALVLKRNLSEEWARRGGKSEVEFYTEVRSWRDELPMIVPCYDAAYDSATGDSHLLLLELSASHEPLITRDEIIALHGVPTEGRLEQVVDIVARLHAHWWEHPSLVDGTREVSGWYGTRERFEEHIQRQRRD